MTSSRYLVARVAQAFGYFRRAQRMADAASEMHLLREAEAQLGATIWEKVENIEELSVEYWNLRKLIKERDEVARKARRLSGTARPGPRGARRTPQQHAGDQSGTAGRAHRAAHRA